MKLKKVITKLEAFKQAEKDINEAMEIVRALEEKEELIDRISVSTNLEINFNSSEKQYMFAIGVLKSNIEACKDLGIDPSKKEEDLKKVKELFKITRERNQWEEYTYELRTYRDKVKALLSDDDKFALLEYPSKK